MPKNKNITVIEWNFNNSIISPTEYKKIVAMSMGDYFIDAEGNRYESIRKSIRKNPKDIVYSGVAYTLYPDKNCIISSEINGKKIIELEEKEERFKKFKIVNNQCVSDINYYATIEGAKKRMGVIYSPLYNAKEVFASIDFLFSKNADFRGIDEFTVSIWGRTNGIDISYDGGGYGEKYYASSVNINVEEFLRSKLNKYLTKDFIGYLIENGTKENGWLNILYDRNSWEVEVEYEAYEGYRPQYYKIEQKPLENLNKNLYELYNSYKGEKFIDWKYIKL